MPIDARIPLTAIGPPVKLQTPNEARAEFFTLRQLEGEANDADNARQQRQSMGAAMNEAYADGDPGLDRLRSTMTRHGLASQIPEMERHYYEGQKEGSLFRMNSLKEASQFNDVVSRVIGNGLLTPDGLSDANMARSMSDAVQSGLITPERAKYMIGSMPPVAERRGWAVRFAALSDATAKEMRANAPTTENVDTGAESIESSRNPLTGEVTQGRRIPKQVSPDTRFSAAQAAARQRESDARADTRQSVTLQAAREARAGGEINDLALDGMVERLLAGDPPRNVMSGVGRGAQGARNLALVNNRLYEVAQSRGIDPTKITNALMSFASDTSAARIAANAAAKIGGRERAIQYAADLALDASETVPRGDFVPWTRLKQYTDAQLSDPDLRNLKVRIQTLGNEYAAAMGGGTPTVHSQERAEELLSTVDSPEVLKMVADAMKQEAAQAGRAFHEETESITNRDRRVPDRRARPVVPRGAAPKPSDFD